MEAVNTNILGANNITLAAENSGVKKCIMLSTDKAVYPINAMGLSKSMMEKIMIAKSRSSKTIFCATRYGNVMGTREFCDTIICEPNKKQFTNNNQIKT